MQELCQDQRADYLVDEGQHDEKKMFFSDETTAWGISSLILPLHVGK